MIYTLIFDIFCIEYTQNQYNSEIMYSYHPSLSSMQKVNPGRSHGGPSEEDENSVTVTPSSRNDNGLNYRSADISMVQDTGSGLYPFLVQFAFKLVLVTFGGKLQNIYHIIYVLFLCTKHLHLAPRSCIEADSFLFVWDILLILFTSANDFIEANPEIESKYSCTLPFHVNNNLEFHKQLSNYQIYI